MSLDSNAPLFSVDLVLSGKRIDIGECTKVIGIEPTSVWRQCIKKLIDHPLLPNAEWCVGIERRPCYSSDEAVSAVIEMIWPKHKRIKEYAQANNLNIGIVCLVAIPKDQPVYELSPKTMERMAILGARFSMDIHDYSSEEE